MEPDDSDFLSQRQLRLSRKLKLSKLSSKSYTQGIRSASSQIAALKCDKGSENCFSSSQISRFGRKEQVKSCEVIARNGRADNEGSKLDSPKKSDSSVPQCQASLSPTHDKLVNKNEELVEKDESKLTSDNEPSLPATASSNSTADASNTKEHASSSFFEQFIHMKIAKSRLKSEVSENISLPSSSLNDEVERENEKDKVGGSGVQERGSTLLCPLCWKKFQTSESKVSHMKACAAKHKVPTRKLLEAVQLQEKQAKERRALGLPVAPKEETDTKKSVKRKDPTAGSKSCKIKDYDLQLALALSASLKDAHEKEKHKEENNLLEMGLEDEVQSRRLEQEKQEAATREDVVAHTVPPSRAKQTAGRDKKKKRTYILETRTKEEREQLISEKVAIILMGDEEDDNINSLDTATVPSSSTKSIALKSSGLKRYYHKESNLWHLASVSPSSFNSANYYVSSLSTFISPCKVPAGSKLKHLSQVAGRKKSPVRSSPRKEFESQELCTQAVLEKLAEDGSRSDNSLVKSSPETPNSWQKQRKSTVKRSLTFSPTKNTTNCEAVASGLVNDWKLMVNKKTMSDVIIYVKDNNTIFAHKLVLYVRCPQILRDMIKEESEENEKVVDILNWIETSFTSALAFVQYLYCGVVDRFLQMSKNDILEVLHLAQQYDVNDLTQYLKVLINLRNNMDTKCNGSMKKSVNNIHSPHKSSISPDRNMKKSVNNIHSSHKNSVSPDGKMKMSFNNIHSPHKSSVSPDRNMKKSVNNIHSPHRISVSPKCSNLNRDCEDGNVVSKLNTNDTTLLRKDAVSKLFSQRSKVAERNLVVLVDESPENNRKPSPNCKSNFSTPQRSTPTKRNTIASPIKDSTCHNPLPVCSLENLVISLLSPEEPTTSQNSTPSSRSSKISSPETNSLPQKEADLKEISKLLPLSQQVVAQKRKRSECESPNCTIIKKKQVNSSFQQEYCDDLDKTVSESTGGHLDLPLKNSSKDNSLLTSMEEETGKFSKHDLTDICKFQDDSNNSAKSSPKLKSSLCSEIKSNCNDAVEPIILDDSSRESNVSQEGSMKNANSLKISDRNNSICNPDESIQKLDNNISQHSVYISSVWDDFQDYDCDPANFNNCDTSKALSSPASSLKVNSPHSDIVIHHSTISPAKTPVNSPKITPKKSTPLLYGSPKLHKSHPLPKELELETIDVNSNSSNEELDSSPKMLTGGKVTSTPITEVRGLNDSLFWRAENEPRLDFSTKDNGHCSVSSPDDMDSKDITPLPDYSVMPTPVLKNELKRYGLKPLKRRQAKLILRHIYSELHSGSSEDKSAKDGSRKTSHMDGAKTSKLPKKNAVKLKKVQQSQRITAQNVESDSDAETMPSSQESTSSGHGSVLEESLYHEMSDSEENTISQKASSENLPTVVQKLIETNPDLHKKVLQYEPIWIEELHATLKANGLKFKMNELMDFLDEQCITFRVAQGSRHTRRRRSPKKCKTHQTVTQSISPVPKAKRRRKKDASVESGS